MLQIACSMEGSSSQRLQRTCRMKGSSSKMLQIACSMEGTWQDRCRGRKTEQIRKKKSRAGEKKSPARFSTAILSQFEQLFSNIEQFWAIWTSFWAILSSFFLGQLGWFRAFLSIFVGQVLGHVEQFWTVFGNTIWHCRPWAVFKISQLIEAALRHLTLDEKRWLM